MKSRTSPTKKAGAPPEFVAAFRTVLTHELDRRILLELAAAGRELRHEELRKAVHEESKQQFQYALDRLNRVGLVNRRLVEAGERYQTHLSPTPRGLLVSKILRSLGSRGRLPQHLPDELREQLQAYFAPPIPA